MTDMEIFTQYELDTNKNIGDQLNPANSDFVSAPNVLATAKSLVVKDKMTLGETEFHNNNGLKQRLREVVASTNVLLDDFIVSVTNVGTARTLTLPKPSLAGFGKTYVIKDGSGSCSATTITIAAYASELIDNDTSYTLNIDFSSVHLITNGVNWYVV